MTIRQTAPIRDERVLDAAIRPGGGFRVDESGHYLLFIGNGLGLFIGDGLGLFIGDGLGLFIGDGLGPGGLYRWALGPHAGAQPSRPELPRSNVGSAAGYLRGPDLPHPWSGRASRRPWPSALSASQMTDSTGLCEQRQPSDVVASRDERPWIEANARDEPRSGCHHQQRASRQVADAMVALGGDPADVDDGGGLVASAGHDRSPPLTGVGLEVGATRARPWITFTHPVLGGKCDLGMARTSMACADQGTIWASRVARPTDRHLTDTHTLGHRPSLLDPARQILDASPSTLAVTALVAAGPRCGNLELAAARAVSRRRSVL